jgi:predicted MPP superfamily phosphohydrolase
MLWLALLILLYGYLEARFISVRRDVVHLEGLPTSFEGFTIIHLSDLHAAQFGARERRLCRILRELNGDLVVFTGDYKARKRMGEQTVMKVLDHITGCIRSRFGVLGVLGNKDGQGAGERIGRAGIELLSGRSRRLTLDGDSLWIAGIDSLPLHRIPKVLLSVTSSMPEGSFRILISHGPDVMPLARRLGYRLILCGDTHGGQIRLPLIGAVIVKSRVSRRYCRGLVREGSSLLCISAGIGTCGFPVRTLCPPEVRILTLASTTNHGDPEET